MQLLDIINCRNMLVDRLKAALTHTVSEVHASIKSPFKLADLETLFFEHMVNELDHIGFDYPVWNSSLSSQHKGRMGVHWVIINPFFCNDCDSDLRCGVELYVNHSCEIAVYQNFEILIRMD
ncbi:hypothetical protein [Shewanella goraebulensis]|uniref:hypothetical protein n=1 Tax=Shewanella goraebulensis TaxID=3050637 RepID=UPI00254DE063|nr:hypothetical protein [Shewanella goraebulensis]